MENIVLNTEKDYHVNLTNLGEFFSITVNKELCVELKKSDCGYIIDLWKVPSENDDDLINSITIWEDDLLKDK